MILSDREIRTRIESGDIKISPMDPSKIGPCSVDLTLSSKFQIFKGYGRYFDAGNKKQIESMTEMIEVDQEEGFLLMPGQFVLASTQEKISISPKLAATLEGKSSVARMGIIVHAAGLVNPGTGTSKPTQLTLEIYCMSGNSVRLPPGMEIIQIIFHELTSEASVTYDQRKTSSYVGLDGPKI